MQDDQPNIDRKRVAELLRSATESPALADVRERLKTVQHLFETEKWEYCYALITYLIRKYFDREGIKHLLKVKEILGAVVPSQEGVVGDGTPVADSFTTPPPIPDRGAPPAPDRPVTPSAAELRTPHPQMQTRPTPPPPPPPDESRLPPGYAIGAAGHIPQHPGARIPTPTAHEGYPVQVPHTPHVTPSSPMWYATPPPGALPQTPPPSLHETYMRSGTLDSLPTYRVEPMKSRVATPIAPEVMPRSGTLPPTTRAMVHVKKQAPAKMVIETHPWRVLFAFLCGLAVGAMAVLTLLAYVNERMKPYPESDTVSSRGVKKADPGTTSTARPGPEGSTPTALPGDEGKAAAPDSIAPSPAAPSLEGPDQEAQQPRREPVEKPGSLKVTLAEGVEGPVKIEVDDRYKGKAPLSIRLSPGFHDITIRRPDSYPSSRLVRIKSGQRTVIHVQAEDQK